jgi:predicted nucleotidyltransferase
MPEALVSGLAKRVPRLAKLVGTAEVEARWEGKRAAYLWQTERDLELLARHVEWTQIAATYRKSLRNPAEAWGVSYELRTAAKLAPAVDDIELRPRIGTGRACDLAVRLGGRRVFVEVTTRDDIHPWRRGDQVEDPFLQARETVHREYRTTTPDRDIPTRDVPASEELRNAIREKVGQLPPEETGVIVLGTPNSRCLEVEDALFGDGYLRGTTRSEMGERVPNGLLAIADSGMSRVGAVVWLKLRSHWNDVRSYGRLFLNERARHPLGPDVEAMFRRVFDPARVRQEELHRIGRLLVERYHAERIIVFGSLASHFPADAVHDASDIDLAVIKVTSARFVDRVREAMDLVEPRLGLNLFVYTPEEITRAQSAGPSFIRDEILAKGKTLFPRND